MKPKIKQRCYFFTVYTICSQQAHTQCMHSYIISLVLISLPLVILRQGFYIFVVQYDSRIRIA